MSKPYYVIQLEDYTLPSYLPFPKTYYGTLDQIRQLIYLLASEEWTREYYTSTISAMDSFDFGNLAAVHDVAGHMERLLTPVGELCRSAYLCGGAQWYYTDQYGCYNQHNRMDTEAIKAGFEELYERMTGMPLRDMDDIVYTACTLCREHEKSGFVAGVKVGMLLAQELK